MLMRWNDWGLGDFERTLDEFDALRREMNRVFDQGLAYRRPERAAGWPRVALFDRGNELVLRAEVPGMKKEDLFVTVEQGVVTLKGERKLDAPEGYAVHRQERSAFRFGRSFTLPCRVDGEKASAKLEDGVLVLTLPKTPDEQPRQITVH
jgi:HSP20 family protein